MDDHSPSTVEHEPAQASWTAPVATNGATAVGVKPTEPEIVVPAAQPVPSASPMPVAQHLTTAQPASGSDRVASEQLARIEDKTSRIEEKFARSEAAMQRVVDRFDSASGRMSEVASQAELAAVRGEVAFVARRVRNLPGNAALAITAIATAVLTAIVTIAILKYVPGLLAR